MTFTTRNVSDYWSCSSCVVDEAEPDHKQMVGVAGDQPPTSDRRCSGPEKGERRPRIYRQPGRPLFCRGPQDRSGLAPRPRFPLDGSKGHIDLLLHFQQPFLQPLHPLAQPLRPSFCCPATGPWEESPDPWVPAEEEQAKVVGLAQVLQQVLQGGQTAPRCAGSQPSLHPNGSVLPAAGCVGLGEGERTESSYPFFNPKCR